MKLHIDTFSRCRCRNYAVTLLGWLFAATMWGTTISPAIAQTVIGSHVLASSPYAIAINQITNRTYVTHGTSVTVIDGATNTASTIAVGGALRGLAVNPATNRIYVVNNTGNSVAVIDGANNTVISTITVGTAPQAIAASACTVDSVRRTYT